MGYEVWNMVYHGIWGMGYHNGEWGLSYGEWGLV